MQTPPFHLAASEQRLSPAERTRRPCAKALTGEGWARKASWGTRPASPLHAAPRSLQQPFPEALWKSESSPRETLEISPSLTEDLPQGPSVILTKRTTLSPIPPSCMYVSATWNFKGSTPRVNRKGGTQDEGTRETTGGTRRPRTACHCRARRAGGAGTGSLS